MLRIHCIFHAGVLQCNENQFRMAGEENDRSDAGAIACLSRRGCGISGKQKWERLNGNTVMARDSDTI